MTKKPAVVHGTALAVALDADGPLAGALLLGPSGSGKSALALCAIETCPFRRTALVADDAPLLFARGGGLWAKAPERLAGLIEVRGFGPAPIRSVASVRIVAAFELAPDAPRLPESAERVFAEGAAPTPVWPFAAGDGAARLRLVLRAIVGGLSREASQDGART
jgi:serine kinase of HPr protein (carbohydrate metabolism regulator)